mmetsp:Transcript_55058/g.178294  ORF Transcript_55058/g.178294 Transcript_55058/m.178294 type:complete len:249 (-) Transcript_55058:41-787(-)
MGAAAAGCLEGLAPGPPMPKTITLKYFPMAGRAEPIRLALTLGGLQFFDQRIPGQDWTDKYKPSMPYGQLPVLVVDGKTICQTKAILRYVGKLAKYNKSPLYPKDPVLAAKVDELLDAFDDLWILLAPTFLIKDQYQKEEYRQQLFAPGGVATEKLAIFERTLADSGTGFAVPQAGFSVADLMYYSFLCVIRSGFLEGLGSELLKGYPSISKHKEMVANLPAVKAYYADKKRSNPNDVPNYEVFSPGK